MAALRRSRFLEAVAGHVLSAGPTALTFPDPEATAAGYLRNVEAITRLAAPARVVAAPQPSLASTRKPLAALERRMLEEKEAAFPGYTQFVRACSAAMDAALDQAGAERIELDGALGGEPRLLFADECHFGDEAAAMVARTIADGLAVPAALSVGFLEMFRGRRRIRYMRTR